MMMGKQLLEHECCISSRSLGSRMFSSWFQGKMMSLFEEKKHSWARVIYFPRLEKVPGVSYQGSCLPVYSQIE